MLKRRWNVHLVWIAIVLAGGVSSFYFGSYAVGFTLTQLAWQNHRSDHFGDVKSAIRLLTQNDLTAYHRFSEWQLRDGIEHLAVQDSKWRCSDTQRRTLSRARTWWKDHPDPTPSYAPFDRMIEKGWSACGGP